MCAPLLIADIPWLLYRSFFALPRSITDEEGRPVNALLGCVNALLSVCTGASPKEHRPRAVVACLGAEQASYRVESYPAYHAHRDPMPRELAEQWERAPRLLESFGWAVAGSDELEADDVMFSFARVEAEAGGRTLLLTGDRDLFQVVEERVAILELGGGAEIGAAGVRERYGIEPQLVPDFIALRGDPSDGLPGAPGIGAKTAAELLRRYGSLEAVLRDATGADSDERPRIVNALRENADQLRTFKEIATLVRIDVQRPADRATDFASGAILAREMGMRRLASRLDAIAAARAPTAPSTRARA